jgi:hypothetical protein
MKPGGPIQKLLAFVLSLQDAGFDVSTHQYFAIHSLLLELLERGEWPRHTADLKLILAPLVCSTPAQQDEFYLRFEEWVAKEDPRPLPVAKSTQAQTRVEPQRPRPAASRWICVAAGIVLIAAGLFLRRRPVDQLPEAGEPPPRISIRGVARDRRSQQPISNATFWYAGTTATTDVYGAFTLLLREPGSFRYLVTHRDYHPILRNYSTESEVILERKPWARGGRYPAGEVILASGGDDGTVRLWNLDGSPRGKPFTGHNGGVRSVAFAPQGSLVASASTDGTVRFWNFDGTTHGQPLRANTDDLWCVSFSPKGDVLVSSGPDGTLQLWNADGTRRRTVSGHRNTVYWIAFSPRGDLFASAGGDDTVRLWNADGNPRGSPLHHKDAVFSVAFSPAGDLLASSGRDGIRLWNLDGSARGEPITHHRGGVPSVAFSPRGDLLASSGWDGTVRLWNLNGSPHGQPLTGHTQLVIEVAFSPYGDLLASASNDGTIRLWNVDGTPHGAPIRGHTGNVNSVAFSPVRQPSAAQEDRAPILVHPFLFLAGSTALADPNSWGSIDTWLSDVEKATPNSSPYEVIVTASSDTPAAALADARARVILQELRSRITKRNPARFYNLLWAVDHAEIRTVPSIGAGARQAELRVYGPRPVSRAPSQPAWREALLAHFTRIRWFAALLPGALLLVWWLWLFLRRFQFRKWTLPLDLSQRRVGVRGSDNLFRGPVVRKLAQEMRRRRPRISTELSAAHTVAATAGRAGYFTPVYAERRIPPEYLVLVERVSSRDQHARLEDRLLARLTAHGVFVDRYYYSGDPRRCRASGLAAASLAIEDLAGLHPHHHVLIVGNAENFVDRISGRPAPWLPLFSKWQNRAILNTMDSGSWAEAVLESLGFRVFPAGPEGMALLADSTSEEQPRRPMPAAQFPWPELLREIPDRWLGNDEPTAQEVAELSTQLRRYLGLAGYDCLSACAIYPALSWNLTLEMARTLLPPDQLEPVLARLVRLPWFRHGTMPDWLRLRLVSRLPAARQQQIRAALTNFLANAVEQKRRADWLEYARITPRQRLLVWWRRRDPRTAAARDYVFVSFLWGRKLDRLAVSVPGRLKRLLFHQGHILFGARAAVHLAIAAVLGFGLWTAMGPLKKRLEIPIEPAPVAPAPPPGKRPQEPAPLDPFRARVLDVAESQIGTKKGEGLWEEPFGDWCFRETEKILGASRSVAPKPLRVEPGVVFSAGVIERVSGTAVTVIQVRDGVVRRMQYKLSDSFLHELGHLRQPLAPAEGRQR